MRPIDRRAAAFLEAVVSGEPARTLARDELRAPRPDALWLLHPHASSRSLVRSSAAGCRGGRRGRRGACGRSPRSGLRGPSISSTLAVMLPRQGSRTWSRASSSRPAAPKRSVTGQGFHEVDQGRVDPVLERRLVLDQVEAKAGELALFPDPGVGEPDRRHQVAAAQDRQHPRVDLVGLGAPG
jgi:hypothetical protein